MMKRNATFAMYTAWAVQLCTLFTVVTLGVSSFGQVSSSTTLERHFTASLATVSIASSLATTASVSTGMYYLLRSRHRKHSRLENNNDVDPEQASVSSKYVLLFVGLVSATCHTVSVCFSVAAVMVAEACESCSSCRGLGSGAGNAHTLVALSAVAFVAHATTVTIGHGYAFERQ